MTLDERRRLPRLSRKILAPTLNRGDIVVMDDQPAHKGAAARTASRHVVQGSLCCRPIRRTSIQSKTPSKYKSRLRKAAAIRETLVADAFQTFVPERCSILSGILSGAGYAQPIGIQLTCNHFGELALCRSSHVNGLAIAESLTRSQKLPQWRVRRSWALGSGRHYMPSRTALRNWRVRSLRGLVKNVSGGPSSSILPVWKNAMRSANSFAKPI